MPSTPFEGELVILRPFEPEDVPAAKEYLNHPEMVGRRCIPWGFPDLTPLTEGQVTGILERWAGEERGLIMAVEAQVRKQAWGLSGGLATEATTLVGHAEVGWEWDPHSPSVSVAISPLHQRKGYGSDALQVMLRFLFHYGPAHCVGCWVPDWNEPALAFLQKNGFHLSGRMRRAGLWQGRPFDVIITDILRPEWLARQGGTDAAGG
jgi:RimJ/RimL family protein N-acetyltransferase